jgi:hypothetical protein
VGLNEADAARIIQQGVAAVHGCGNQQKCGGEFLALPERLD